MNLLLESLDPLARLILQALLNSLWQGLLIAALVWVLLRVIGQVSATTRHAVWLVSLVTIGLLPALALTFSPRPPQRTSQSPTAPPATASVMTDKLIMLPDWRDEVMPLSSPVKHFAVPVKQRREAMVAVSSPSVFANAPMNSDNLATRLPEELPGARVDDPPVATQNWAVLSGGLSGKFLSLPGQFVIRFLNGRAPLVLAAVWLLVCVLMCGRIARSYLFLFRLRRQLAAVPTGLNERMRRLSARFGIRRRVGLFTAEGVKMPMTVGWLRPLIVLPQDLLESLSTAECDSVIAHEMAHIKRWDYATNFIQRVVQALFFFQPAVWFINKQLVIERELACDDWAVKLTGEPRRYASCLAKLVELLSESKPLAAATGILFGKHIISRRVEMILNRDRNATTSVSKPALFYAIGLAFLFVFAFSTLSPVIAVPLAQKPAKKVQEAKPAQPRTPSAAPALPAEPVEPRPFLPDLDEFAPLPPHIALDGELMELHTPPAWAPLPGQLVGEGLTSLQDWERTPPPSPVASTAPLAPVTAIGGLFPTDWPTTAPLVAGAGWGQDAQASTNKTPTIPESELLSLLSDIVKRDADANVRREALQGIARLRSDAAINTLLQLYDAVTDVKLKGEILGYVMRRNGDNSKAIAKLVQIAKTEKNEELLGRALSQLAYVKGDEGADQLIQIYDGLQDAKLKQRVIRSLAYNKSKKAIDKLMSIAKNDADPVLRQAAIRSIYEIDSRLYLNFAEGNRQGLLQATPAPRVFTTPRRPEHLDEYLHEMNEHMQFDFDGRHFDLNQEKLNNLLERAREMQERTRDLNEKMKFDFDGKVLELNKQQLEQFQQRAREAQERAREQMRELQEQWREQPTPRGFRYRNDQEPQQEQTPQPVAKPQQGNKNQKVVRPAAITATTR